MQATNHNVCVTKESKDLLELQPETTSMLVFNEHLQVIREGARGMFQTFTVQVKAPEEENSSSSEIGSYDSDDVSGSDGDAYEGTGSNSVNSQTETDS